MTAAVQEAPAPIGAPPAAATSSDALAQHAEHRLVRRAMDHGAGVQWIHLQRMPDRAAAARQQCTPGPLRQAHERLRSCLRCGRCELRVVQQPRGGLSPALDGRRFITSKLAPQPAL